AGVTGVILAGGRSSRMGMDKSLLPYNGRPLIETVFRALSELFKDVVVVTDRPDDYGFLPCPKIPDIHAGQGSMAGVHAGLKWSRDERIFVVLRYAPPRQGSHTLACRDRYNGTGAGP